MQHCGGRGEREREQLASVRRATGVNLAMSDIKQVRTVHSDPLHDIRILGQHDDRLEVALDQRSIGEGVAQVEGLVLPLIAVGRWRSGRRRAGVEVVARCCAA